MRTLKTEDGIEVSIDRPSDTIVNIHVDTPSEGMTEKPSIRFFVNDELVGDA